MKSSERLQNSQLVNELDMFVSYQARFNNLFNGGCCMVGGVLAEQLEMRDIPFKVAVYSSWYCPAEWRESIQTLGKHDEIAHVSIEVDGRPIGDNTCFENGVEGGYVEKTYFDVSADELKDLYVNKRWNQTWDKRQNSMIEEHVKHIFSIFD